MNRHKFSEVRLSLTSPSTRKCDISRAHKSTINCNSLQSSPENKRRRTAPSPPNDDGTLSIANLPHDHLTAIADYLPRTSRGLLAVALTSTSKAFVDNAGEDKGIQLNEASKAIISMSKNGGWERLYVADVGELAERLTDNDVHALLTVIDAKNNLTV